MLASLDEGLIVLDRGGRVIDINPAAEQLLGLSEAAAVATPLDELAPRSTWLSELVRGTLGSGVVRRRPEGELSSRGNVQAVSATCAPVLDEHGTTSGAVLILHPLSLQHSLEDMSRRAERLATLGTVAAGLAHEIRNPLGGIKGAAQLLRTALADPELLRCTEIIIREVERLNALVEHLRDLSSRPALDLAPINVHRILNDVVALERQAPEWGTVTLRTEFDPSLPPLRGDAGQLTQVFLNLVKNALEAMGGTGELVLTTRIETRFRLRRPGRRGQFLTVAVEDTGPGVPETDQLRLFAPFFSTKPMGGGLGLTVCQRIITEHGGAITHEARAGGGACFRVTLPVSEEP